MSGIDPAKNEPQSRLKALDALGQAVWLDFIDRAFLASGSLEQLIDQDGVSGVTSNPSIFQRAIAQSSNYDEQLLTEWKRPGATPRTVYDALVASDVSKAADILLPTYRRSGGCDGYVSVEVSPDLAFDTARTIDEARHLWTLIAKPNLMVKIPGTEAGVAAMRQLIEEGININVTLLFAVERYAEVLEAYISALENRSNRGHAVDQVAGVASFFVSRIDVEADGVIEARIAAGDSQSEALRQLKGSIAIASAKKAYHHYQAATKGSRWRILADKGALPHRLLWASTGAKNPECSDVLYVDNLIGPGTINTMPPQTMDAFRDHGKVAQSLCSGIEEARAILRQAKELGINLDLITAELLRTGIDQFKQAMAATNQAIIEKHKPVCAPVAGPQISNGLAQASQG